MGAQPFFVLNRRISYIFNKMIMVDKNKTEVDNMPEFNTGAGRQVSGSEKEYIPVNSGKRDDYNGIGVEFVLDGVNGNK